MKFLTCRLLGILMLCCVLTVNAANAETAVSEKAQRFFNRGTAAIESASGSADFKEAAEEFRKAYETEPKWPDPYYNAGIALEKAGDPAGAAKSFRLYLKAAPDAADASKVRQKADKLEFLAEKMAKKTPLQDAGAQDEFKTLLKSLEGALFRTPGTVPGDLHYAEILISEGKAVLQGYTPDTRQYLHFATLPLTGFSTPWHDQWCESTKSKNPGSIILSPDGKRLIVKSICSGKELISQVYKR